MTHLGQIRRTLFLLPLTAGALATFGCYEGMDELTEFADARRPVEVDAAHEDQLVAWLSKRMGAPMKPPHLQAQGYTLEGGRLLPGGQGPVAQFMYRNELGSKLTLYVSNDVADVGSAAGPDKALQAGVKNTDTAFRFARAYSTPN